MGFVAAPAKSRNEILANPKTIGSYRNCPEMLRFCAGVVAAGSFDRVV